jgi:hypothetical protein
MHARLMAKRLNDRVFDAFVGLFEGSCKSWACRIATWLRSWRFYAALVMKC